MSNTSTICEISNIQNENQLLNNKLNLIKDKKSTKKKIYDLLEGKNKFNNIKYTFNNDIINIDETKKLLVNECKERAGEFVGFTNIIKNGFISNNNKNNYKYFNNINYLFFMADLDENEKPVNKKYLDDIKNHYLKYNKKPFILSAIGGYCFSKNKEYIPMVENTLIFGFNKINDTFYNLFYKSIKNLRQNSLLFVKTNQNLKNNLFNFINHSKFNNLKFQFNEFINDYGEKCGDLKNIFFEPSKMNLENKENEIEEIKNELEIIKPPLKKLKTIKIYDLPEDILNYIYEIKDKDEKEEKEIKHNKFLFKIHQKILRKFLRSDNFRHHLEYNDPLKLSIDRFNDSIYYTDKHYERKAKDYKKIINDNIQIISNKLRIINLFNDDNITFFNYCFSLLELTGTTCGAKLSKCAHIRNNEYIYIRLIPNYSDLIL